MDRFACGHCGAGIEVQRRGGTVALRVTAAASGDKQSGNIGRLTQEVENLSKQRETMLRARTDRNKWGYGIAAGLIILGFFLVRSGQAFVYGLIIMVTGMFAVRYLRRSSKKVMSDVSLLEAKIDLINGRIHDRP